MLSCFCTNNLEDFEHLLDVGSSFLGFKTSVWPPVHGFQTSILHNWYINDLAFHLSLNYPRVYKGSCCFVPLVEQELLTLPEHLSSPPVFSGVRVTRSLVLYVCFVDRCLSFCSLSFGHCVVCSSLIYGLWLPLWYLQTLFVHNFIIMVFNILDEGHPLY